MLRSASQRRHRRGETCGRSGRAPATVDGVDDRRDAKRAGSFLRPVDGTGVSGVPNAAMASAVSETRIVL